MIQPSGIHHIHKRERAHKEKLKPYPSKNKWISLLDRLLIAVAVAGPLTTLPQIFKIFIEKTALGVSLVTWIMFMLIAIPWLVYGIVHKEKPIIIAYVLNLLVNTVVVVGILIYS